MKLESEHVEFIHNSYEDGKTREEIFQILSERLGNKEILLKQVRERFQRFKNGRNKDDFVWSEDDKDLQLEMTLIFAIESEFQRQRAYCEVPSIQFPVTYSELSLDERYLLFVGIITEQTRGLILYDTFHGKKRFIPIESKFDKFRSEGSYQSVELLAPNCLIIKDEVHFVEEPYNLYGEYDYSILNFVEINWEESRAKIVNKERYEGHRGVTITVNLSDPNKFLVINKAISNGDYYYDDRVGTCCFCITIDADRKSAVEEEQIDLLEFYHKECYRYVGDRLQGLKTTEKDEKTLAIAFYEYKLNKGDFPSRVEATKLFDVVFDDDLKSWNLKKFFWHGDLCYLAMKTQADGYIKRTQFYVLDVKEQTLTKLNAPVFIGTCCDLNVDDDGILTAKMCTKNASTSNSPRCCYVIHRIPLRKPDTLLHLCIFKIRHHPRLSKHPMIEKIMSQLPLRLQPLALCPTETKEDDLLIAGSRKRPINLAEDFKGWLEAKRKKLLEHETTDESENSDSESEATTSSIEDLDDVKKVESIDKSTSTQNTK